MGQREAPSAGASAHGASHGAHVAVLEEVTLEELRRLLTEIQMANGFANRHLFASARHARLIVARSRPFRRRI
jgi:hypothetical protein